MKLLSASTLLLLASLFMACAPQSDSPAKIRVLLDTDANNELDDQHAIAYLLLSGDVFATDGITVNRTFGGGDISKQAEEAERIVRLCNLHPQIPVYAGANGSFEEIVPHVTETDFDGAAAVNFIIEKAHESASSKLILVPVGKLTNIALALAKDPSIAEKVRILWLGSNYPDPGEYNQENDEPALNSILDTDVPFEIALVRYDKPSGTAAVLATLAEMEQNMPGAGPRIAAPVVGRHGGEFTSFGDYSLNLFRNIELYGDPPARALFDMAAVAIVKNPAWATAVTIPAPTLVNGQWQERPDNPRKIILWENFDRDAILADFFATMRNYVPVK
ncbi:nucleoside hydrolase [candidate division KSB1 bacterium]|nr:nucleoside hydrolase [candidate division KSB1 bacterium]RQW03527.1 MAG: nucleoside hydrolase [candidate division KSB1 bacterium]